MKILNPIGEPAEEQQQVLPRVPRLNGLRIAVLTNHWTSMDRMAERFRVRASQAYSAGNVELFDIPINGAMSEAVERQVLRDYDVAIVGLAN
jgi:hypothetical protein